MPIAYIGLSTNLGDKHQNLANAKKHLQEKCKILQESKIYQTESWGIDDQPDYFNQNIEIETDLEPQKLLEFLLNIETKMGRTKQYKFAPRIIDLDILFYEDIILNTETLIIPHPLIQDRNFVLAPLAEIAPNLNHPKFNLTIKKLLEQCTDQKKYFILP